MIQCVHADHMDITFTQTNFNTQSPLVLKKAGYEEISSSRTLVDRDSSVSIETRLHID